jgi:putative NIF3 family GTP cyclohydrolase 1 type 2
VALLGRDAELSSVDAFLRGTKKVLWMHGPGGIGKSRLLLEVGAKAEAAGNQVLWAIEATMSRSTQWFSAVNYNLPTVLLLDEPQDPDLIRAVAEQLRTPNSQMQGWKAIITVRSPNDPVLKAVTGLPANMREDPLVLGALTPEMSKKLASELIAKSTLSGLPAAQKETIAEHLSRLGDRFPIWIAIAVNVLAKHGNLSNLPQDADDIARKYVDEVIERSISRTCTQEQLQAVLRWVAIYEELNREEASSVSFVSKQAVFSDESRFLECLNSLVARKFVVRRGVNQRLYSIKPDVVREFVVRDWLTWSVDNKTEATPAAESLVALMLSGFDGKPLPSVQALVKGLAKTEFSANLQGTKIELLTPLVSEIKRIAAEGTVLEQQGILSILGSFDFARLGDVLDIVRTIRLTERPAQEYSDFFGHKHEVTHKTVVAELAWPLFNAARYARSQTERAAVLEEMMALSICESNVPDLFRNDGKRADALIPRIISGENDWYPGFKTTAREKAMALLTKLRDPGGLDEPTLNLVRVLCGPFLSVEQERTSYKQHAITVTRWFITLTSPDGVNRNAMRALIRETIESDTAPPTCRLLCWKLLSSAHSSANRALLGKGSDIPPQYISEIKGDLKSDLSWALEVLRTRTLEIGEIRAARELWEWHYKFEEDEEIKKLAGECEEYYKRHPLAEAFHVFFSFELFEEAAKKAAEVGNQLGVAGTCETIRQFLQQAQEFAQARTDFGNILPVAEHAAAHWEANNELAAFTHMALTFHTEGLVFTFAVAMLNRRLRMLRESNRQDALKSELQSAIHATSAPEAKAKLLLSLYSRPHPLLTGILTVTDLEFAVPEMDAIATVLKLCSRCQIAAGMYHTNWDKVKSMCDETYSAATEPDRPNCFAALFDALHFLDLFGKDYPMLAIKRIHFDWLLDMMVTLPDLDQVGEYRQHELEQFLERFGRRDLSWLIAVVNARIPVADAQGENEKESFKLVPTRHRLTMYVREVSPGATLSDSQLQQVNAILGYAERRDMLGYIAPQYAVDLDPHGVVVPGLIASRIESLHPKDKDSIWMWARFAGYYALNSPPWKQIATAAIRTCTGLTPRDKSSVFVVLLPQEIKSSNYPAGEMDPRPEQDLLARKREMLEEMNADLIPFRQWHLAMAQAEFDQVVARYKEENEQ